MRLEKISLIIVLICAIILLAVPFYRNIASSQIKYVTPCREQSIWKNNVEPTIITPQHKTDAQLLKEHPKDFMLRLALVQKEYVSSNYENKSSFHQTKQQLDELLRNYPKKGVLYAVAMGMPTYSRVQVPRRIEGSGITPEEVAQFSFKPDPVTKKQLEGVHRCIKLLDEAIIADPDNGWFHYQRAMYLYGLHQDNEAMQEVHLSAITPRFTDYTDICAKSIDHLYDLRGDFDPAARCSYKSVIAFKIFALMREVARITAHLAYKDIRLGNKDRGIRTTLDITNAGYNMTKNAPTFIHGLVGTAIMHIGASALDPKFDPKSKNAKTCRALRLARYKKYLVNHGYPDKATVLGMQCQQADRFTEQVKVSLNALGENEYNTLMYFSVLFATAMGILTIAFLFMAAWAIMSLLTRKIVGGNFWDKKASITSTLLCLLVFAPLITDLVTRSSFGFSESFWKDPERSLLLPIYLLIPLAVMATALLSGFIMMLMRTPKDGENRRMPAASLLIAWLAAVGGLVYLTYGLEDFAESIGFFESLKDISPVLLILGPIVAVIIYAAIRAMQSRFGCVKRSAMLTFVATIRYSSAIAVSLFCIAYLFIVMLTAHFAIKADAIAKENVVNEAPIIRSVFNQK